MDVALWGPSTDSSCVDRAVWTVFHHKACDFINPLLSAPTDTLTSGQFRRAGSRAAGYVCGLALCLLQTQMSFFSPSFALCSPSVSHSLVCKAFREALFTGWTNYFSFDTEISNHMRVQFCRGTSSVLWIQNDDVSVAASLGSTLVN